MREAGIGRVLVASIHQGIADILALSVGTETAADPPSSGVSSRTTSS